MSLEFFCPVAPLFVPGNKPELFDKAGKSGADALILDLEDAVAPSDKASARTAVLAYEKSPVPVIIRINSSRSAWFEDDISVLKTCRCDAVMLPKAESRDEIERLSELTGRPLPVIALIESASGLASLSSIAGASGVAGLAFGALDLALDLDCQPDWDAMLMARSALVLAARLAGLPGPLDGVTPNVVQMDITHSEAAKARALGFRGKMAIHPKQIEPILKAMLPTPEEIAWATSVIDITSGSGVARLEGAMIDAPLIVRARRILAARSLAKA